jgi:hypothetical protein
MPGGSIRGVVGVIKWSYYNAAAINGYAVGRLVDKGQTTWTLRATVVQADRFKMSQRPLMFVAPFAGGLWSWPILEFDLRGGELTAALGPPTTARSRPIGT